MGVLLLSVLVQVFSLSFLDKILYKSVFKEIFSAASFIICAIYFFLSFFLKDSQYLSIYYDAAIFRLPRAILCAAGLVISLGLSRSKFFDKTLRSEQFLILSLMVFLLDQLLVSSNIILSFLLLIGVSVSYIAFIGMSSKYNGKIESLTKSFTSLGFGLIFSSICIVYVLVLVSSGDIFQIKVFLNQTVDGSLKYIAVLLCTYLPMVVLGNLFPFHFFGLDRSQGVPWCLKILSSLMQGIVLVTSIKFLTILWSGSVHQRQYELGFLFLSLLGGVWLSLFLITQPKMSRAFSAFTLTLYGIVASVAFSGGIRSLAVSVYAFSAYVLSVLVFGYIWGRTSEICSSDEISEMNGLGQQSKLVSLLIFWVLGGLTIFPFFPGLVIYREVLRSFLETGSGLAILVVLSLMLNLGFMSFRYLWSFLLLPAKESYAGLQLNFDWIECAVLMACAFIFLVLGVWGFTFVNLLDTSAKLFLK